MTRLARTGGDAGSVWLGLAVIAVFGVMYACVARLAFDGFPYSGDEYSLALQGELFARGLLHGAAPAHGEWLRVDHVVIDTLVRSKYPPGAPALLAIGARYDAAWLVTPLEGVAALVVGWLTIRRALGGRAALVGLVCLGLAPLFAIEAASFYAHTATTLALAIAYAAIAAWLRAPRPWYLVAAGLAIGAAFLIRPIDALLFGAAMLQLRSLRAIAITAASALPAVAVNLWYQDAQFGSPLTDGYHAYEPTFTALYGGATAANPISPSHLASATQWWNHIDVFRAFSLEWTVPATVIVASVGAVTLGRRAAGDPARKLRSFTLAVIITYAIALLVMISDPDDGPRPRYLSPILLPVAYLAAAGFPAAHAAVAGWLGRRAANAITAIVALFALAQIGSYVQDQVPKVWRREAPFQLVAAADVHHAIVIIRAHYPSRFARNGGVIGDGDVLYLSAPADVSAATIAAAYPDRAIYEAHEADPWTLTRVR